MSSVKHLLQGKPLHVPVHAGLVHLPIAFLSLGTLLDVAAWVVSSTDLQLQPAAFWSIAAGIATALVAAVFGLADFTSIRDDQPAKKHALQHLGLNVAALVLFAASLLLRHGNVDADRAPAAALAASVAACGLLLYSGYIGGRLVYDHGVGVGRHRRATPLPSNTIEREGSPGEFVPVCRVDAVADGQVLRLNLGGTIMALVRRGGEFFAVQEFCTHRFGPLSEGCLRDGNLMCPWHRSAFDPGTGAVAHGPAKVPLRTFVVRLSEGAVHVQVPPPPSS